MTQAQTHLLLATFIASPLDAGLSLLLVVVSGEVIVAVSTSGAAANHAHGAPLALCSAIGTDARGVGQAVAPGRDGAGRAHGGGGTPVAMLSMAVVSLGLGCRACGAGSGGCRAVHALTARWRRWEAGKRGGRSGRGDLGQDERLFNWPWPCRQSPLPQRSTAQRRDLPTVQQAGERIWGGGGAGVAMVVVTCVCR